MFFPRDSTFCVENRVAVLGRTIGTAPLFKPLSVRVTDGDSSEPQFVFPIAGCLCRPWVTVRVEGDHIVNNDVFISLCNVPVVEPLN